METRNAKVYFFDIIHTLTEQRSPIDDEMTDLLVRLLQEKAVGITSGGPLSRFEKCVLSRLPYDEELLKNLYLFPDAGSKFYTVGADGLHLVYNKAFLPEDRDRIVNALNRITEEFKLDKEDCFGKRVEDTDSIVVFSCLGGDAPTANKKVWDSDCKKRIKIKERLDQELPGFDIRLAGTASLNIMQKGVNKSLAVTELAKRLGIDTNEIVYIGDSFCDNGQDCDVCDTGAITLCVGGVSDTKGIVREALKESVKDLVLEK